MKGDPRVNERRDGANTAGVRALNTRSMWRLRLQFVLEG